MSYEKLIYKNSRGETLEFSPGSILHCNVSKEATGLSDINNTIYTASAMGQEGETITGQKYDARTIKIKGQIQADKDTAILWRRKMTRTLNPALDATLTYQYGSITRVIDVKTDDAPVYKRDKVWYDFEVDLIAPVPFWRNTEETRDDIAEWTPEFEFECEIDATDGMEFASRTSSLSVDVYNPGDVPTGVIIEFKALTTVVNPKVTNLNTGEYILVKTTMQSGDVVRINTKYGQKSVTLIRDKVETNYFRLMDVGSTFFQLDIGDNEIEYGADSGVTQLDVSVYHEERYLSV